VDSFLVSVVFGGNSTQQVVDQYTFLATFTGLVNGQLYIACVAAGYLGTLSSQACTSLIPQVRRCNDTTLRVTFDLSSPCF
jgi:hypothetical protein